MQGTDTKRRRIDALALLIEEGPVQGAQVLRHCRENSHQAHLLRTSSSRLPAASKLKGNEDAVQRMDTKRCLVDTLAVLIKEGPLQGALDCNIPREIRAERIRRELLHVTRPFPAS